MGKSSSQRPGFLPEAPAANRVECVYLTCFRSEFSTLALVLKYSGVQLHRADTLEEADFLLTASGGTVLLSDVAFLDGSWRDALLMVQTVHPLVAAMIVADAADWPSLADAYERGACGAQVKPVSFSGSIQMIRTLHQAALDRRSVFRGDSLETARVGHSPAHCR
jgi:DNA-binding NtrC family response regulator